MSAGSFKYEDCPLKHHIRTQVWLPTCKLRLASLRAESGSREPRRLRYFTFCAVGAIDVLMLDIAKVITRSKKSGFDTVFFFDRKPEFISETQKRIPGAIGFPGNFLTTILMDDPAEDILLSNDHLTYRGTELDEFIMREQQRQIAMRREFVLSFPFDVINLDLEEFMFKPKDEFPGEMVRGLRKIFEWQRRDLILSPGRGVKGFSLMFTTQIGPPKLREDYRDMLRKALQNNLDSHRDYKRMLHDRTGIDDTIKLQKEMFDVFFKMSLQKLIAVIAMEEDWYIDSAKGIQVFELGRSSKDGPYTMLHLVMDIIRKNPPRDRRAPGSHCSAAREAYNRVVHKIFADREIIVSKKIINQKDLENNLNRIKSRRRKYFPYDS